MSKDIQSKFIIQENVDKKEAENLATRVIKFGRITKEGKVVIDDQGLKKGDQQKLALVIKYTASLLDENIDAIMRPIELASVLNQRIEAVGSGLSKLVKVGFAKKTGSGKYAVLPYKINSFLEYLERPQTSTSRMERKTAKKNRKGKKKTQPVTGIGVHIQRLVDENFFEKPKLMSEVVQKLREENIFTDPKVIDKTVRDTFISSRRTLQRILNSKGGKAKWLYVKRN